MKKLLYCLVVVGLVACGERSTEAAPVAQPGESFEAECMRRLQPTEVHVRALPSNITYDFEPTIAQLTHRSPRQQQLKQVVLGLTEATLRTNISWNSNMLVSEETGRTCMRPQLTLTFHVNPQVVSVAREFPKGTCAFNEIATHELRHVRANQKQLEDSAVYMERELTAFFGQKIFYGSKDKLKLQLEDALKTTWMPLAQAQLNQVNTVHNAIDSPQEYARNETVCNGDITRAIRQAGILR